MGEGEWLPFLAKAAGWIPPYKDTIIIAPHPDDETLGAGGLIAWQRSKGIAVSIVAVTDGEACYPGFENMGAVRQLEQQSAARALGVESEIVRLGFPDSSVTLHEADLQDLLHPLISRDTLVLTPWDQDCHPDHEACGRATMEACKETGAEIVFYPIWSWHQKTAEDFHCMDVHRFELTSGLMAAKECALNYHRSQLEHESGEPILPERLLTPFRRSFETYLTYLK